MFCTPLTSSTRRRALVCHLSTWLTLGLVAGCSGSGGGDAGMFSEVGGDGETAGPGCEGSTNLAPSAPVWMSPEPPTNGIVDTELADFVMVASTFSDPDEGATHAQTQFEIWSVNDGVMLTKVWSADVSQGDLESVSLADGNFVDPEDIMLERWKDHAIRVRYGDSDECPQWSDWSESLLFQTDDGSDELFDPHTVHDIYLTIPPESWDAIDDEAIPPGCVPHERSFHRGTFQFDDQLFENNVGIRSKGGCGSARHLDGKTAFKIDLEWDDPLIPDCAPDRRLFGQSKVTLNNMIQDPSYSRERIGYAFYRAVGISTPRVAYVRVHVNGEYWGLYLHQESITRRFLDRWYSDNDGVLYEGTYGCDVYTEQVPGPDIGGELPCFDQKFKPNMCDMPDYQPVLDHSQLLALTTAIDAMPEGEFYPAIQQYFDFDQFMNVLAVDGILSNWDGFPASANNFRIYRNPDTQLWSVIPTGIDQNFQWGDGNPFSYGTRMVELCMGEEDCRAAFATVLSSRLAVFQLFPFEPQLAQVAALVGTLATEDPRAESDESSFVEQQSELNEWIVQRPEQVQEFLTEAGF